MSLYSYKEFLPSLGSGHYFAPGSRIIGRAKLGDEVSVWHNAVIRADVNTISIGAFTNVQDLCVIHVTAKFSTQIEENVTLGHGVTVHGATISRNCLIGMSATILDGVSVGEYSIVGAGSLLPPGKTYPPRSLILGSPAKVVREITADEEIMLNKHYKNYLRYAQEFIQGEREVTRQDCLKE